MEAVKIIECPRDAWQGLAGTIPADEKVRYHRALIEAGFRHLDAVSFVSPKLVPQMADSEAVMNRLFPEPGNGTGIEIIGIVVNEKGVERALACPGVTTLGYPHSLSATFLRKNQNQTVEGSRRMVEAACSAAETAGKGMVVYLSMAFGNPYGDDWSAERAAEEVAWLADRGVKTVSLADTVGKASADEVAELFSAARAAAEAPDLGVHLHSRPDGAAEKVMAAWEAGCRRFDSALTGLGGCPFAEDELVGNLPTETVLDTLAQVGARTPVDYESFETAIDLTRQIRSRYDR